MNSNRPKSGDDTQTFISIGSRGSSRNIPTTAFAHSQSGDNDMESLESLRDLAMSLRTMLMDMAAMRARLGDAEGGSTETCL